MAVPYLPDLLSVKFSFIIALIVGGHYRTLRTSTVFLTSILEPVFAALLA